MKIKNNLVVSAHQPAFLPWLGYIEKFALSDTLFSWILQNLEKEHLCIEIKLKLIINPTF